VVLDLKNQLGDCQVTRFTDLKYVPLVITVKLIDEKGQSTPEKCIQIPSIRISID